MGWPWHPQLHCTLHWFVLVDAGGRTTGTWEEGGSLGRVGFWLHPLSSSFMPHGGCTILLFTCGETSCVSVASATPALCKPWPFPWSLDGFSVEVLAIPCWLTVAGIFWSLATSLQRTRPLSDLLLLLLCCRSSVCSGQVRPAGVVLLSTVVFLLVSSCTKTSHF